MTIHSLRSNLRLRFYFIIFFFSLKTHRPNAIRMIFKNSISKTIYEFENRQELDDFVKCLSKLLFNSINLAKCELYYCVWCNEFNKKSKFKLIDEDDVDDDLRGKGDGDSVLSNEKAVNFSSMCLNKDDFFNLITWGLMNEILLIHR